VRTGCIFTLQYTSREGIEAIVDIKLGLGKSDAHTIVVFGFLGLIVGVKHYVHVVIRD
jgi:hypothetical protein